MVNEQELKKILVENELININEQLTIEPLGTGERNQNYLINNQLVLRIGLMNLSEKYLTREFKWLKKIKTNAPKPLHLDTTSLEKPFSILSYTEGKQKETWTNEELALHAKQLANLNKTKSKFWGFEQKNRMFDIEKSFLSDVRHIGGKHDADDKAIIKKTASILHQHLELFTEIKEFSLIHGDCCNSNILHHNGNINYIDWEWSTFRDNAEDPARLYYENCYCPPWSAKLDSEQINFFLDEYQKHHPDPTLKKRVELWNRYWRATDYLHFKRVLQEERFADLNKQHYQHTIQELKASLQ
jgi:aminoglycoside phosphotransferase (APT) family kinase protein